MFNNNNRETVEAEIEVILNDVKTKQGVRAYVTYMIYKTYANVAEGLVYEITHDGYTGKRTFVHENGGVAMIDEDKVIYKERLKEITNYNYASQVYVEYPKYGVVHTKIGVLPSHKENTHIVSLALVDTKFLETLITELRGKSYVLSIEVMKDKYVDGFKGKEVWVGLEFKDVLKEFNELKYLVADYNTGMYSTTVTEKRVYDKYKGDVSSKGRLELVQYIKPNGYLYEGLATVDLDSEGITLYKLNDGSIVGADSIIERSVAVHSLKLKKELPLVTYTTSERVSTFVKVYKKGDKLVIGINVLDKYKNARIGAMRTRQISELFTFCYFEFPIEEYSIGLIKQYSTTLQGEFEENCSVLRRLAGMSLSGMNMAGNNTLHTCSHRGETYFRDRQKAEQNLTSTTTRDSKSNRREIGVTDKVIRAETNTPTNNSTSGLFGKLARALGGTK